MRDMNNIVAPYVFEYAPIRIQAVRMTDAWQALHQAHDLPAAITHTLGRCAAATTLLATTIKFDGRISVQLQSKGPLQLLLCQATHDLGLRGMAQLSTKLALPDDASGESIRGLADNGQLAVTIENMKDNKRYQGITPIVDASLAASFEHYFSQSEQLPTRLWLAANDNCAAGLMVQRMPGELVDEDVWERCQRLAETLTQEELLTLAPDALVHRLFHEEDLRQLTPRSLHFNCNCSQKRVGTMLASLGAEEVNGILQEQKQVEVTCEFCGRSYTFDDVDAAALFTEAPAGEGSDRLQ